VCVCVCVCHACEIRDPKKYKNPVHCQLFNAVGKVAPDRVAPDCITRQISSIFCPVQLMSEGQVEEEEHPSIWDARFHSTPEDTGSAYW